MNFLSKAFEEAGGGDARLMAQMQFLFELEKLKAELRQTMTYTDKASTQPRNENSAEHSWHITTFALILGEYAAQNVDMLRVAKMLLIHDIIEIDAGDTDCYSDESPEAIKKREYLGAERIFALLPADQATEYRAIWDEFEGRQTPESKYARAIDSVHPILANYLSGGKGWQKGGVPYERVVAVHGQRIQDGAPALWALVKQCLDYGRDNGFFPPSPK